MTQALEVVAGRRGGIISDGKTGNDVQTRGALWRLGYEIKRAACAGGWQALSRSGRVRPAVRLGLPQSPFCAPWSRSLASGRLTVAYTRELEQLAGLATCTVILQNAKVPTTTADRLGQPEPDTRQCPHGITTLTPPRGVTGARLRELHANLRARIAALPTRNVRAPGERRRAPAPMARGSPNERSWRCVPRGAAHAIAASIAGRWVQRTPMLGERPPAPASED